MFMKRKGRGIGYAHPVEWTTRLGETIVGSVMIKERLALGKNYANKRMQMDKFLITWTHFW